MKEMQEKYAAYNAEKPSVYSAICDSITATAQAINIDTDIQAYVAENRTGVTQPPDIQYSSWDSDQPSQPKKTSSVKIPKYKGPGSNDILNSKVIGDL
jgi:hypothetical protein